MTMEAPAVVMRDLELWYGDEQVLFGIDLDIPSGVVTTVSGRRNQGKTSLFRCIDNTVQRVVNARTSGRMERRAATAMVPEKYLPLPMSYRDNVLHLCRRRGLLKEDEDTHRRVREALEMVALWDRLADQLDEPVEHLGLLDTQRLGIASALATRAPILLLDDIWEGWDFFSVGDSAHIAQERNACGNPLEDLCRKLALTHTLLIVTADVALARRLGDYAVFLDSGKVLEAGPTEDVFNNPRLPETAAYIQARYQRYGAVQGCP